MPLTFATHSLHVIQGIDDQIIARTEDMEAGEELDMVIECSHSTW
jgi:hypothetical protein